MVERRSLLDALSSDDAKRAFINSGLPAAPGEDSPPIKNGKGQGAAAKHDRQAKRPGPTSGTSDPSAKPSPDEKKQAKRQPETCKDRTRRARRSRPQSRNKTKQTVLEDQQRTRLTTPVVSITTRFRQPTAEALRKASLQRKLAAEQPSSQQEIVELAVSSWLETNGYL